MMCLQTANDDLDRISNREDLVESYCIIQDIRALSLLSFFNPPSDLSGTAPSARVLHF